MTSKDDELISGVLRGDQDSIRLFTCRWRPGLMRFALQKVDLFEDAEEIVQDALVSAIYSLPTFLGKSNFSGWLYGIARHEVADFYRKKKIKEIIFSHFPILETIAAKALSPELALEEKEMEARVLGCFLKLSEGYQEILRLKYTKGLSLVEIGLRLEKSAKGAESRLRRARHQFARIWNDQKNYFTLNPRNLSFFEECLGTALTPLSDPQKTPA